MHIGTEEFCPLYADTQLKYKELYPRSGRTLVAEPGHLNSGTDLLSNALFNKTFLPSSTETKRKFGSQYSFRSPNVSIFQLVLSCGSSILSPIH